MECVCCSLKSEERKAMIAFTVSDKKLHYELTKLELNNKGRLKICINCKKNLKFSVEFYRLCLKSHQSLTSVETECPDPEPVSDLRQKRTRRKVKKDPEDEVAQDDTIDDDLGSADEDIPISMLQLQINNEPRVLENVPLEPDFDQVTVENPSSNSIKKVGKYLCTDCGLAFQTSQRLQIHSYTHSGIKNFKCEDCDKVFATKFRLKAHTRIHTGERPFVCDICSLSFAQGNALKCHKRVHTKERPFVCKICSKSFSQNTTLKTHMAALHLGKSVACDEPGCDKKFTRRSYLLIHKRDHAGERKYACDRCPNQYKQKSHLDRHIEASHLGIRHKCQYPGCNSEFSKAWSLKMHKFVHSAEPSQLPYQCQHCESGFQRRDKLLKHTAKMHLSELENVKAESVAIQETVVLHTFGEEIDNAVNQSSSNYVVLTSSPEIYTIQNLDGSFSQVQTLEVIESVKN